MHLTLVRHPSLPASCDGRYIGSTEVPLSEVGRREAQCVASVLPASIQTWWCSPSLRCREAAECILGDAPVRFDSDLREMDFGLWEGKTFGEAEEEDPELASRWAEGDADFCFPGGESIPEFAARLSELAQRLGLEQAGSIGLITHGGVIGGLLSIYFDLPIMASFRFRADRGSITRLHLLEDVSILEALNDKRHLPSADGRL